VVGESLFSTVLFVDGQGDSFGREIVQSTFSHATKRLHGDCQGGSCGPDH
jgi:hypothetical protein